MYDPDGPLLGAAFRGEAEAAGLQGAATACAPRNVLAVGACRGMAQECADRIGDGRRQDVLEVAGFFLDLRLVHLESLGEQGFGEAVAADQAQSTTAPFVRERRVRIGSEDAVGPHPVEELDGGEARA